MNSNIVNNCTITKPFNQLIITITDNVDNYITRSEKYFKAFVSIYGTKNKC